MLQMPFVRGLYQAIAALVAMQFIGRTLAEVVPVTNEDQFLNALMDGSDIQIEASFSVSSPASVGMSSVPGSSIISILGACSEEQDGAETRTACEITLQEPLQADGVELWLHNLVLQPGDSFQQQALLNITGSEAKLWMTNVSLQGNVDIPASASGAWIHDASAYFSECTFKDLLLPEGSLATAVQLFGSATATFEGCSITGSVPEYPQLPGQPDALVPAVIHLGSDGTALLLDTGFSGQECQAAPKAGGMFGPGSDTSSPALEAVPCIAATGVSDAAFNATASGVGSGVLEDDEDTLPPALPVPVTTPTDESSLGDVDSDVPPSSEESTDGQGGEVDAGASEGTPDSQPGGDELVFGGGLPLESAAMQLQTRKALQWTGIQKVISQQAATSGAQLFTDDDVQLWGTDSSGGGDWIVSQSWEAGTGIGLTTSDPNFEAARQELLPAAEGGTQGSTTADTASGAPSTASSALQTRSSRGGSGNNIVAIVIGVTVVVFVLCAAAIAGLIVLRRRERKRRMADGARGLPAEPSGASNVQELHAYSSYQSPAGDAQADSQAQSVHGYGGMAAGHSGKYVAPGQLVAPPNAAYAHQYTPAASKALSAAATSHWEQHGASRAAIAGGSLLLPPGKDAATAHTMHALPPGAPQDRPPGTQPPGGPAMLAALNKHNLSILEQTTARTAVPGPFAPTVPARSMLSATQGLNDALDSLIISGRLLMSRYMLDGGGMRHCTERAVLQCATDTTPDGPPRTAAPDQVQEAAVAVKFFLKRAEYDREEELLRNSSLVQVIDPGSVTRLISNFDGSFRAPNGYIYPPCIAMPCGQCLTQLLEDRSLSHADVAQMLVSAGSTVASAHRAGWVHRNLHPGNVLRNLTASGHWMVSDWNCAARIGTCPQATGRLLYVPPEDVVAVEQGQVATKATAAADMWALGMMAYEALTGTRVFAEGTPDKLVRDALTGRHPLPWERMDAASLQCMDRMQGFKSSVLQCLDRNPHARPRAAQVVRVWQRLSACDVREDASSHDVPASSLESSAPTRNRHAPVATGGYSAKVTGASEDAFVVSGPPPQSTNHAQHTGTSEEGRLSSTAPVKTTPPQPGVEHITSAKPEPQSEGDERGRMPTAHMPAATSAPGVSTAPPHAQPSQPAVGPASQSFPHQQQVYLPPDSPNEAPSST